MYEDDRDGFYSLAEKFLLDDIMPSTLSLIGTHHLLSARKEMLEEGISMYQCKKYPVANSVLALQVEGIIRDALVSSGFPEKKIVCFVIDRKGGIA